MADSSTQRAAFTFLQEHLQTQEPFTLDEFMKATGWEKPGTLNTYLRKQYKGLIEKVDDSQYRVTDAFWRFASWRKFRAHVTQVRRVITDYAPTASEVLIYDFLMPLSNEEHLRMTLDALFYKDRLLARVQAISSETLEEHFPRNGTSDTEYFDGIIDFINDRFVGYSVSHVDGRFRGTNLRTHEEAAALEQRGERYLIDETTAVSRFIFPYQDEEELSRIRFLFEALFIRSIIQLVSGEEQIWMVQSGSAGSRLHIWERLGDEEDEDDF
ncbi:MAG: hypothetical protein R3C39_13140 [Dehalococcoidia bacterium]